MIKAKLRRLRRRDHRWGSCKHFICKIPFGAYA